MIKIEICAGSVKKPEPSSMVVSKGKTTVLLKDYALGPKTEGLASLWYGQEHKDGETPSQTELICCIVSQGGFFFP